MTEAASVQTDNCTKLCRASVSPSDDDMIATVMVLSTASRTHANSLCYFPPASPCNSATRQQDPLIQRIYRQRPFSFKHNSSYPFPAPPQPPLPNHHQTKSSSPTFMYKYIGYPTFPYTQWQHQQELCLFFIHQLPKHMR